MKEIYFNEELITSSSAVPYGVVVVISIHVYTIVVLGSNLEQETCYLD
jgi:hypothetical protein